MSQNRQDKIADTGLMYPRGCPTRPRERGARNNARRVEQERIGWFGPERARHRSEASPEERGLAPIMGAGDIIKPAAPNLAMLGPAFAYFASWYILGLVGFWVFGFEPRGRTFDEIDEQHEASVAVPARVRAQAT
jgi:hypothetical protein